jgi:hypothetical protein
MRHSKLLRGTAVLAATALLAACASGPTPSGQSSSRSMAAASSPQPSPAWVAARVEQPAAIEAAPTDAPVFCSPCHPIIGTYIDSLVTFHGGFLAFGHDQPPSHAALWSSNDAGLWRRVAGLPAPEGSSISAAVANGGTVLAVGTSGGAAAAWRSTDGAAWTLIPLPEPEAGSTERLTAVAESGGGYVAGGYVQSATAVRAASLWRSMDGAAWRRAAVELPGGPSEITGIAAVGPADLVAVGIAGDERSGTAAVWRSTDGGASWSSVTSPAFSAGRMLGVVAGGPGIVAVGELAAQTGAAAWFSADGSDWQASSGPGLDYYGLEMVMTAVSRDGSGFVAAGWRSDAGNGSAVVWRSSDGRTWVRLAQEPSFSGAGLSCVLGSPRLLVGGTMGWPDTHAAQVWTTAGG